MRYSWWIIDIISALLATGLMYLLATYGLVTVPASYYLVFLLYYLSAGVARVYRK